MRIWTVLLSLVVVAAFAMNASAADKGGKKGGQRPDPGARFDDMDKKAHDGKLTGEVTKDEFVKVMKDSGSKMADKAGDMFDRIKKADPAKLTKQEYIDGLKSMFSGKKKKE
jgi:hypothetical protein